MPRREDIHTILVLGSGPIKIGQAAEFDFSGSQAVRALREDGYEVILVNSNPATIQNDPEMADKVYIEPLLASTVESILRKEKPDALLAGMGGQTALNIASQLAHSGLLEELGVELIGSDLAAIDKAEDRQLFNEVCVSIGLSVSDARACHNMEEILAAADELGTWPLLIRPAFTLGGLGGGTAYDTGQLVEIASLGLRNSHIGQVLIEESIIGWQEYEYEVMRDGADNCLIVCTMENIDPMGVHTGESVVIAPIQSLSDSDHQMLRDEALALIRALDIRGGCNVQFAFNQFTGESRVIEVNPRVSRSSALASKATGYPIARMAAKIAVGYNLGELPNPITGDGTTAAFEPTLDYCVIKIPRWPFDKFRTADRTLGTSMKSTGEVMAIGRNFEEAFLKAWSCLEQGCPHPRPLTRADESDGEGMLARATEPLPDRILVDWLRIATDRRMGALIEAFRRGWTVEQVHEITRITRWFLYGFENIARIEGEIRSFPSDIAALDAEDLLAWKSRGFSDGHIVDALSDFPPAGIASLGYGRDEESLLNRRHALGIHPRYRMVDSCAAEFAAKTPYYYSTYEPWSERGVDLLPDLETRVKKRQVVLGSGPIRIGQGIEFDYGCVHAVMAIREAGMDSILINNNPETVSTDFDTSDRLYFEPLTLEYVTEVLLREQAHGILLQFGGQTAINVALPLKERVEKMDSLDVKMLGTSCDAIDEASDRARFESFATRIGLLMPNGETCTNAIDMRKSAARIGFPVLIRPSYVLGGRGMEILGNQKQLDAYLAEAYLASDRPLLVDEYLGEATELDVDAVCDGDEVLIGAVMEHLEEAGIHSGDSTCFIPTQNIDSQMIELIEQQTRAIGLGLGIVGCYNIQFAIKGPKLYVLEVNPRSSRTVPFVAKSTGLPLARIAARCTLGIKLAEQEIPEPVSGQVCVKAPVFPFIKLQGLDPAPGPEMKSTGEVYGCDLRADIAYLKARLATEVPVATGGAAYLTVRDGSKEGLCEIAHDLIALGFNLFATQGTADVLRTDGVLVETVYRIAERKHPDALDLMRDGTVSFIVNVPTISGGAVRDGNMMRRLAVELNIPFVTTMSGARMEVAAIKARQECDLEPMLLKVNY